VNSMCTVAARGGILCNELGALTNIFNLGTIVTHFAVVSASKTVAIVASECSRIGFSPAATVNLTLVLVDTPPRINFARLLFIEVHMMYDSTDPDEAMRAPTIVVGTIIWCIDIHVKALPAVATEAELATTVLAVVLEYSPVLDSSVAQLHRRHLQKARRLPCLLVR
jgi:hypothetical protein